jgi:hypothetical protein
VCKSLRDKHAALRGGVLFASDFFSSSFFRLKLLLHPSFCIKQAAY